MKIMKLFWQYPNLWAGLMKKYDINRIQKNEKILCRKKNEIIGISFVNKRGNCFKKTGRLLLLDTHEQLQFCARSGIAEQFTQRPVANQPDAFACEREFLADFFERELL